MASTTNLRELYRDNERFRRYVDRNCILYQKNLEEMLKNSLSREYAKQCVEEEEIDPEVIKYLEARDFPPQNRGDKIRGMCNMEISVQIAGCIVSYLVQNKIIEGTEADNKGLISGIADDILVWLEQEVQG